MSNFYAVWQSDARSTDDLFTQIVPQLVDADVAKATLTEALITREAAYPTGLDFGHVQVALPHADPEHVQRAGILLVRHSNPITFGAMGEPGVSVQAKASLWPIVVDAQEQVELLGKLIGLLQDEAQAEVLLSGDRQAALALLEGLDA